MWACAGVRARSNIFVVTKYFYRAVHVVEPELHAHWRRGHFGDFSPTELSLLFLKRLQFGALVFVRPHEALKVDQYELAVVFVGGRS